MYSTHKEVKLLSRRLGMLHLTLYFFILAYVLGVRIYLERRHVARELSEGTISARLEGFTYATRDGVAIPVDAASLVRPHAEHAALFLPTRMRTTRRQTLANCTDPAEPCIDDGDCRAEPPIAYGVCERGQCVRLGWCPHEAPKDRAVTEMTILQEPRAGLAQLEQVSTLKPHT